MKHFSVVEFIKFSLISFALLSNSKSREKLVLVLNYLSRAVFDFLFYFLDLLLNLLCALVLSSVNRGIYLIVPLSLCSDSTT